MATTYTGNPANSSLDATRFLLSDTSSPWSFTDAEINWALGEVGDSHYAAALTLASQKAAEFASSSGGTKTVGDLSISAPSNSAEYWNAKATTLRALAMRHSAPMPYAGGLRDDDKRANADDDTLTTPSFARGMHDNFDGGSAVDPDRDTRRNIP